MALNKKTTALFYLMELFLTQKEITPYDEQILDDFSCSSKTLERYLQEIESLYDHIITIKKGHKKVWRLISVSDIFQEFVDNSYDISQLFLMAREFDPEIFKELERGTLSKIAQRDKNVFLFKNSIMEELQDEESKRYFNSLKKAIATHEYRDIGYSYNQTELIEDAKPIKLLFMDNNWYVVIVEKRKKLRLLRLSFIKKVKKRASQGSFQLKEMPSYLSFLTNIQNAMSLYDQEQKVATIKATPAIAKYFQKDMKKFLPSQTFKDECDDGSILFTLTYTQELEILPFIQKWLPDLIVIEPKELRETYRKKLERAFKNHLN